MPVSTRHLSASILLSVTLSACGGGELVGSCNGMTMSDESRVCIDIVADDRDLFGGLCSIGKGEYSAGAQCDQSGAIAGCKKDSGSIMWMYPSNKTRNLAEVEEVCAGDEIVPAASDN